MKSVSGIGVLSVVALAGSASGQVLNENWDNPFGEWRNRWFFQNATVDSYYFATGPCPGDPGFRGNNECGLWPVDTQGCSTGASGNVMEIRFNPGFGATIEAIQFNIRCWVGGVVTIKDMSGAAVYTSPPLSNGQFPVCGGFFVQANSTNGVSAIHVAAGGQVEGNTAIDDLQVTLGNPCYPDCDTTTGQGVLDVFDFLCFQNRYDAGAPYACDCDTSTGPLTCDVFDFLCFQNAYDAGCP